jgi:hypothetical protein
MKAYKVKNDSGELFEVDEDKLHEAERDGYLPVVSNGKEEHRVASADLSKAEADGYKPLLSAPDISEIESGWRGSVQGASLGLADEGIGFGEALWDIATTDKELKDFQDLYGQHRDESREANKAAQEANPNSYLAGNIGGSIATAFVPGLGALNAAKGAKLATQVGKGALAGGIAGFGSSDAEGVELLKDTATGVGFGAAVPVAFKGAGKVVSKLDDVTGASDRAKAVAQYLSDKAKKLPETFVKHGLDLPQEAIDAIKGDKNLLEASKNAMSEDELIDLIEQQSVGAIKNQSKLSNDAWAQLTKTDDLINRLIDPCQLE